MAGFFILLLLIFLIHYWYVVLTGVAVLVLGAWGIDSLQHANAEAKHQAADRLRHERARQHITAIERAATQAMFDAARFRTDERS